MFMKELLNISKVGGKPVDITQFKKKQLKIYTFSSWLGEQQKTCSVLGCFFSCPQKWKMSMTLKKSTKV